MKRNGAGIGARGVWLVFFIFLLIKNRYGGM